MTKQTKGLKKSKDQIIGQLIGCRDGLELAKRLNLEIRIEGVMEIIDEAIKFLESK